MVYNDRGYYVDDSPRTWTRAYIIAFVALLIGIALIDPISSTVNSAATPNGDLANSSSWSVTVLKSIPGFWALGLAVIALAVTLIIIYGKRIYYKDEYEGLDGQDNYGSYNSYPDGEEYSY